MFLFVRFPVILLFNSSILLFIESANLYLPKKKIQNFQERILFILDYFNHIGNFERKEYCILKFADFLDKYIIGKASKVELISSDGSSCEIRISSGKLMCQSGTIGEFDTEVEILKSMKLKITLLQEFGPLYHSLSVDLTSPGKIQMNFLSAHLKNLSLIYKTKPSFYAAFSGFIQSSGFGKTKLCLELLNHHPGIYLVIRTGGQTGVPRMSKWMGSFFNYVKSGDIDDLPPIKELQENARAQNYTPGRFLIALKILLQRYISFVHERTSASVSKSDILQELRLVFAEGALLESSESGIFSNLNFFADDHSTFSQVKKDLDSLLNSILEFFNSMNYPFLLFLDELDVFKNSEDSKRATGLNIVRRGLHCLDTQTNLFTLAIGTNSDALEFTPEIRDNSLRYKDRRYLLPPFILSGNWDIFSTLVPYENIILNQKLMSNCAMFNVLVSFGRALWSSCHLKDVAQVALTKLENGSSNSNGALLVLLLVRGNLSVNTHHTLARTLIKSFMSVVSYVSTNAHDLKIGYSSEPILALASRSILSVPTSRHLAFLALKDLLHQRAVDKGRITEAIFEYILLFAIDDANSDIQYYCDPEAPEFPCLVQEKITKCEEFLLESQVKATNGSGSIKRAHRPDCSDTKRHYYRNLMLKEMIFSLLNRKFEELFLRIMSKSTLEARIGTTHFIQIESSRKEDFGNIPNFPGERSMRRNVIDYALLKVGMIRQCGYTMPPNYFGIDFIMPILIKRGGKNNNDPGRDEEDLVSFVAVQSKSTKPDLAECAFKMSAIFHLCRCPNPTHLKEFDCISNDCKAFFKKEDLAAILDDQIVLLLTSGGALNQSPRTSVSLKGRIVPEIVTPSEPTGHSVPEPSENVVKKRKSKIRRITSKVKKLLTKTAPSSNTTETETDDEIIKDAFTKFPEEMNMFVLNEEDRSKLESESYPEFFNKNKIKKNLQPDLLITKNLNKYITVQKMVWVYDFNNLEDYFKDQDDEAESEEVKDKEAVINRIMSLTCVAVHNVSYFEHLCKDSTGSWTDLLKEIINFSLSNFQNVEQIHFPLVQNSMLNGVFCPYYEINPMFRKLRVLPELGNPLENYAVNSFDHAKLLSTIQDTTISSVMKKVSLTTTTVSTSNFDESFESLIIEEPSDTDPDAMEI